MRIYRNLFSNYLATHTLGNSYCELYPNAVSICRSYDDIIIFDIFSERNEIIGLSVTMGRTLRK